MREKVIIAGVNLKNKSGFDQSMRELEKLAHACSYDVVGILTQNLNKANTATYIGSGKVEELANAVESLNANLIIFNDELTASQIRNLERLLDVSVSDRTALILSIFGKRAKSREAKLQVEMAEIKYLLPRLVGSYASLGRQSGGVGTKNKGVGEKKLELDRRKAEQKITELEAALANIQNERETQRKKRSESEMPLVALVGYTNSGKSTLMNTFVQLSGGTEHKKVFEKDMLFATLETSVRKISLSDKRKFLLSDTVGFVSNLPHTLIKAFRSTLEEVTQADLLLHVVDLSNPEFEDQIKVTEDTLREIGANEIPVIYVYNKMDQVHKIPTISMENKVFISAKSGQGLDALEEGIVNEVFKDYVTCKMRIPYTEGALISYLNDHACVKEIVYENEDTLMLLECRKEDVNRYVDYID